MANVEFLWWGGRVVGGGWGWVGFAESFCVQPNFSVEVVLLIVLCCRWGCDNNYYNIRTSI